MSAPGPVWDHRGMRWLPEHERCPYCDCASVRDEPPTDAEYVRRVCRGCGLAWNEPAAYA